MTPSCLGTGPKVLRGERAPCGPEKKRNHLHFACLGDIGGSKSNACPSFGLLISLAQEVKTGAEQVQANPGQVGATLNGWETFWCCCSSQSRRGLMGLSLQMRLWSRCLATCACCTGSCPVTLGARGAVAIASVCSCVSRQFSVTSELQDTAGSRRL